MRYFTLLKLFLVIYRVKQVKAILVFEVRKGCFKVILKVLIFINPFTRKVFYGRLHLPNLRTWWVRSITKKYINLLLPIIVFQVVVKMPFYWCPDFVSLLCCFLDFLFVCITWPILDRNKISHPLIQLWIFGKNPGLYDIYVSLSSSLSNLVYSFIRRLIWTERTVYPTNCWKEFVLSKQSTQLALMTPFWNSTYWSLVLLSMLRQRNIPVFWMVKYAKLLTLLMNKFLSNFKWYFISTYA